MRPRSICASPVSGAGAPAGAVALGTASVPGGWAGRLQPEMAIATGSASSARVRVPYIDVCLLLDRYVDGFTEAFDRLVQVVAYLNRHLMRPGIKRHLDVVAPRTKVDPLAGRARLRSRFRLRNGGTRRQAIGVDTEVEVPHVGAGFLHLALRHRRDLIVVRLEHELRQGADRRAVLRLGEGDLCRLVSFVRLGRGGFRSRLLLGASERQAIPPRPSAVAAAAMRNRLAIQAPLSA